MTFYYFYWTEYFFGPSHHLKTGVIHIHTRLQDTIKPVFYTGMMLFYYNSLYSYR